MDYSYYLYCISYYGIIPKWDIVYYEFSRRKFLRSPSEGVAEGGGWGRIPPRPSVPPSEARLCQISFLDLCIRFGKIISKVCEGFNSGAIKLDTNSFLKMRVFACPASPQARLGSLAATSPPLWRKMKRILMLSGNQFFLLKTNNTNL